MAKCGDFAILCSVASSSNISDEEWRRTVREAIFYQEPKPPQPTGRRGRPKGLNPEYRNKIIDLLADGPKSFSQLLSLSRIGRRNTLSELLSALEDENAIKRTVKAVKGHHVEYSIVGKPVGLIEMTLAFERRENIYKVRPYERYKIFPKAERELFEKRQKEAEKLREKLKPAEVYRAIKDRFKGPSGLAFAKAYLYYRARLEKEKISSARAIAEKMYLPYDALRKDLRERRFCLECFMKGEFVLLIPAETALKSLQSREAVCEKCGTTYEVEWTTEQTYEKTLAHVADRVKGFDKGDKFAEQRDITAWRHPRTESEFKKAITEGKKIKLWLGSTSTKVTELEKEIAKEYKKWKGEKWDEE